MINAQRTSLATGSYKAKPLETTVARVDVVAYIATLFFRLIGINHH